MPRNEEQGHLMGSGSTQAWEQMCMRQPHVPSPSPMLKQRQAGGNSLPGLQSLQPALAPLPLCRRPPQPCCGGVCSPPQLPRPRVGPRLALKVP